MTFEELCEKENDAKKRVANKSMMNNRAFRYSPKAQSMIGSDSALATTINRYFEHSSVVNRYDYEPRKWTFEVDGERKSYTPDYCIEYVSGALEYIEVGYESKFEKRDLMFKYKAFASLCKREGVGFRLISERFVEGRDLDVLHSNLALLSTAKVRGDGKKLKVLKRPFPTTWSALVRKEQENALTYLANQAFHFDLYRPLDATTVIKVGAGKQFQTLFHEGDMKGITRLA